MTKETKIGLLVGMAVIILIGILISDHLSMAQRQQQARLTKGAPELNLAGDQIPPPPANIVLNHGSARGAPKTALPMPVELAANRPAAPTVAPVAAPAHPADSAAVLRQSLPPAVAVSSTPAAGESPAARSVGPSNNLLVAMNSTKPIEGDVPPGFVTTRGAGGPDSVGLAPVKPIPVPPKPAAEAAEPTKAEPVTHHVQSGETLQSISRKYFNNDPNHDKAIFEANRKSIPAMNKLRIGVRLVIPVEAAAAKALAKPIAADSASAAPAGPAVLGAGKPASSGSAATPGTVDYTVKEGQTLSSIAAAALGSKNDWRKLYDLNKDRIKDPNRLAPGTVIRVPKKS